MLSLIAGAPPAYAAVCITLAWILSLLCLGYLGRSLRVAIDWHGFAITPWALDITIGIVLNASYLVVRSFLAKLIPWIPPVLEFELFVFFFLYHLLSRKNNLSDTKARAFSVAYFLFVVISIFANSYHQVFTLLPMSSDPAILAGLTDLMRFNGYITNTISASNTNLPSYPHGIQILSWAVGNPLLLTYTIISTWPGLTVTLSAFMLFEALQLKVKLTRLNLLALASVFLFWRVFVFTFEASNIWVYLEGKSKVSVHFLVVLIGMCLARVLTAKTESSRHRVAVILLSLTTVASLFITFVN
ncbi:MAG: hypothetical protein EOO88_57075, partial [Pedobacter sp.]